MDEIFSKIMVAVDASDNSTRAVNHAISIAEKFKVDLIIMTVLDSSLKHATSTFITAPTYGIEDLEKERNYYKKIHEEIKLKAGPIGDRIKSELIEGELSVVETILDYAERENVDLIIIGTRGRTGFKKLLLGSVSSGVATYAHCSVMVVK